MVNFHPALSRIGRYIESLLPILLPSEDMKNVFPDKPMVVYRRPRCLKDELVRDMVNRENDIEKGVKKCGKPYSQIYSLLKRAVRSKEDVHTLLTFRLTVFPLEWFTFYLVRYVIRFMLEVLLRLSEKVLIIIRVVLPGMVKDRQVSRVSSYTRIF